MRLRTTTSLLLAAAVAVGFTTSATTSATAAVAAACDNAAWKPYWTVGPGPTGTVNGEVRRQGATCGNVSVVAVVYKESGWWDDVVASHERTFAVGTLRARGTCPGDNYYYTQIRINGVTMAESDQVRLAC
ncbi:hypothetical protein [Nonomuraea insulae]|uniref:Secreted protein n=2 Tax=Nonomuraea TaxID=83681 RepID=A0ABP7A013_9ACTN